MTQRSYSGSNTPQVNYSYDYSGAIGRLRSVTSTVSAYTYGYDQLGRVNQSTQTTGTQAPYTFIYGYNLAGGLTTEIYPSQRTVTTSYDVAGRPNGVTSATTQHASGVQYAAHGAIQQMSMANGTLQEATGFNLRLQPTSINLTKGGTTLIGLTYSYCSSLTTADCATNNGNLLHQKIDPLGVAQDYGYDRVNRLTSAMESSGANWSQAYVYDQAGNRAVPQGTSTLTVSVRTPTSLNQYGSNNRLLTSQMACIEYDDGVTSGAGNLTQDGACVRSATTRGIAW